MLAPEVMRRRILLPKLNFREELQMFPFHMVILEKHIHDLLKRKWQSGMKQSTTSYI